ncbi:MAG: hypothetical protein CALGDGBN_00061 [Pseudomonadales bacterium]|nr:hypothetical protein [Pseudomonadales bacterium]
MRDGTGTGHITRGERAANRGDTVARRRQVVGQQLVHEGSILTYQFLEHAGIEHGITQGGVVCMFRVRTVGRRGTRQPTLEHGAQALRLHRLGEVVVHA